MIKHIGYSHNTEAYIYGYNFKISTDKTKVWLVYWFCPKGPTCWPEDGARKIAGTPLVFSLVLSNFPLFPDKGKPWESSGGQLVLFCT